MDLWLKVVIFFFCACLVVLIINNTVLNNYKGEIALLMKNKNLKPIKEIQNQMLLNEPLSKFYINTSHNSYLASAQHGSSASPNNLKKVLEAGARCIELDISGLREYPIVAHGTEDTLTTSPAKLSEMLDAIVKYGFNTSDPLIICLELYNHDDENHVKQVQDLLIEKFGDRLYRYNITEHVDIANVPLIDLLDKVLIFCPKTLLGTVSDLNKATKIRNGDHEDKTMTQLKEDGYISRVYMRGGLRSVISSNFDPIPYWKNKHNMVAMNFQTQDVNMYHNHKFFEDYSFRYIGE